MGSYYNIDAILTDAQVGHGFFYFKCKSRLLTTKQKVPCTFELTVPGLGYLQGNAGEDVLLIDQTLWFE